MHHQEHGLSVWKMEDKLKFWWLLLLWVDLKGWIMRETLMPESKIDSRLRMKNGRHPHEILFESIEVEAGLHLPHASIFKSKCLYAILFGFGSIYIKITFIYKHTSIDINIQIRGNSNSTNLNASHEFLSFCLKLSGVTQMDNIWLQWIMDMNDFTKYS